MNDIDLIQVCTVCLTDITEHNRSEAHAEMCASCAARYDYIEHVRIALEKYNVANAPEFRDDTFIHNGCPSMVCPICGVTVKFLNAEKTEVNCDYCGHRCIKLNKSTVSVYNNRTHMPVDYNENYHLPYFEHRSDVKPVAEWYMEDLQSAIAEYKKSKHLTTRQLLVNNLLGVKKS